MCPGLCQAARVKWWTRRTQNSATNRWIPYLWPLWVSLCSKRRCRELRKEPGKAGGLPTLALQGPLSLPTCQLQCKTSALACFAQETQLQEHPMVCVSLRDMGGEGGHHLPPCYRLSFQMPLTTLQPGSLSSSSLGRAEELAQCLRPGHKPAWSLAPNPGGLVNVLPGSFKTPHTYPSPLTK